MPKAKGLKCPVESCAGTYNLTHANSIPLFVCDMCGHQDDTWQRFYDNYLQLYRTKNNWEQPKNGVSCVLGLFCRLYKNRYGVDFLFTPKSPNPFKSKECKDAQVLIAAFGGALPVVDYLKWAFEQGGIPKSSQVVSLAYLTTPNLIRKFLLINKRKHVLTRSSPVPTSFLEWCKISIPELLNNYTLDTMNDLGSLLSYVKSVSLDDNSPEAQAIQAATKLSLIVDGQLNIER
jgi:hypothetical protein